MKAFWTICCFLSASVWAGFALGAFSYQPWVVTLAFALVAIDMIVAGLKASAGDW